MSLKQPVGWSFLRSKRWIGYFALLGIFSVTCVLLGNWQFARRAEAQAEIVRIDTNYDAKPIALESVMEPSDRFVDDEHKWLPVTMTGTYLADQQMVVRNRPFETKIGFNLIAPLRLEDGTIFMIDRGWVPAGPSAESPESVPEPPAGPVTVTVRLKAGEPVIPGRVSSSDDSGTISLATVNLAEIGAILGAPMYISAFGQLISEEPSTEHGELATRPERDEGPHLSYALQWYVFIAIAAAGTIYGARMEYRALNPAGTAGVNSDKRTSPVRTRRRRLSDAESEDAYLDAQQASRSDAAHPASRD